MEFDNNIFSSPSTENISISPPNGPFNSSMGGVSMAPPAQVEPWFRIMVFSIYILALCVGGIGNSLVCYVLLVKRQRRRSIHLLTLNLAISDLIVTVIYLPTQMYLLEVQFTWGLGDVACRLIYAINSCTVNASIGTLLVITYDRYTAVTQPIVVHSRNTRRTKILIAIVWVVSMVITFPLLLVTDLHNGFCSEHWPNENLQKGYWIAVFVLQLPLPMLFISFAYGVIIHSVRKSQTPFELVKLHHNLQRQDHLKRRTTEEVLLIENENENNNNGCLRDDVNGNSASLPQRIEQTMRRTAVPKNKPPKRRLSGNRRREIKKRNQNQPSSTNSGGSERRKKQQNKLLKMSVFLVITYGICVTPQHAVFFAATYGTLGYKNYAVFVFILSNLLMSVNSALNPCIYGTLNDEIKKSLVRVFTSNGKLSRNVSSVFSSIRQTIRRRFKSQRRISRDDCTS